MNYLPYVKLLRPAQWLKNLMLLFPPFLGGIVLQPGILLRGLVPISIFCMASSSTYIVNDFLDADNDANHPLKQTRPIPSGTVSKRAAVGMAILCSTGALALAARVSFPFLALLAAYMVISTAYSIWLREYPIVDIFCIAAGFLLRLQAGGEVFGVTISAWLFLSVFLLAVFLSTGKRLCEKKTLGSAAGCHRKSLLTYPEGFLDGVMYMTGGAVLVSYSMYVINRHALVYTIPLCTFGLLRYIFRVKSGLGGDPTDSLLKDLQLFIVGLLWVFLVGWGIYFK